MPDPTRLVFIDETSVGTNLVLGPDTRVALTQPRSCW